MSRDSAGRESPISAIGKDPIEDKWNWSYSWARLVTGTWFCNRSHEPAAMNLQNEKAGSKPGALQQQFRSQKFSGLRISL
jgi:hypothetical protein